MKSSILAFGRGFGPRSCPHLSRADSFTWVSGLSFRIQGLGSGVWGVEFRV